MVQHTIVFVLQRRLELVRKDALRRRETPKYDNKCRHLHPEEVQENLSKNIPYCVRFKVIQFNFLQSEDKCCSMSLKCVEDLDVKASTHRIFYNLSILRLLRNLFS